MIQGQRDPRSKATSADHERVLNWIKEAISRLLGISPSRVDPNTRFREFGLDSEQIAGLVTGLSGQIKQPLSPVAPWEYPTPVTLARYVASILSAHASSVRAGPDPSASPGASGGGGTSVSSEPIAIVGIG
ncbi:MAG: acyl carrier protein, partial [Myxococcales bacterium]|nr:acyl carrier protein [Myxococcales bacterium]